MSEAFYDVILGPNPNESNKAHATAYGAILIALLDKGVITQDEYDRAYIQAQHTISQEFARKRDEADKEVEKQCPNLAKYLEMMRGDPG